MEYIYDLWNRRLTISISKPGPYHWNIHTLYMLPEPPSRLSQVGTLAMFDELLVE